MSTTKRGNKNGPERSWQRLGSSTAFEISYQVRGGPQNCLVHEHRLDGVDHGREVAADAQRIDRVEAVQHRQKFRLQVGRVGQKNGPRFGQLENLKVPIRWMLLINFSVLST